MSIHDDTITHWSTAANGFGGFTFGAPNVINGRWEQRSELFRTPQGEEKVSEAVVFVEEDLEEGDYLYLGESSEVDPTSLVGAFRIQRFVRIPGLRRLRVQRKALL